ncbi:MAG: SDR family oxidoreductase [Planctomycetes bacterium]|nr:SDR family oxidoreductase [Planctomycetota bacterium]
MGDKGQVALITGSATGVGRACAVRFAQRGFDVCVNYSRSEAEARETAESVERSGGRAIVARCDVSDDAQVRAMLAEVERAFGRLDVLVNNAARTHFVPHAKLDDLSESQWDEILGVNLKGPFFVTRAAVPLLRKSPRAAIVNVSSVAGVSGMGSSIAYCASKGGLNTLTRSLARALAPIRVNAVCPGPIDSRWLRAVMTEEQLNALVADYPLARAATPDDIADTVLYLAAGTSLTTGQCLVVDGGRTI